jgi:hypothetical protein
MSSTSSSSNNICNYIHTILRDIISEEEEFDLCVYLFSDDYSEEDIAEFVRRKLVKYINNNFEIITYHKNELNTINEEFIITQDITQESINEEFITPINVDDKNKFDIIPNDIEDKPNIIEDKTIDKKIKKNTPKESTSKPEEDFDMNIYISKFKEGEYYINDKRIEIFNKTFKINFLSSKISRLIKDLFTTSSTRINGRKTKTFQIISHPKVNNPKKVKKTKDIAPIPIT